MQQLFNLYTIHKASPTHIYQCVTRNRCHRRSSRHLVWLHTIARFPLPVGVVETGLNSNPDPDTNPKDFSIGTVPVFCILSVNWHHIHDLVSAKRKTKEAYCCDSCFLLFYFDNNNNNNNTWTMFMVLSS